MHEPTRLAEMCAAVFEQSNFIANCEKEACSKVAVILDEYHNNVLRATEKLNDLLRDQTLELIERKDNVVVREDEESVT